MEESKIAFCSLDEQLFERYILVGTVAYNQHYLHLWKDGNSDPYIKTSFTKAVLQMEMQDTNTELFLIKEETTAVGILKLDLYKRLDSYNEKEALLLDKIYLLKEYTGKGIGKKALDFAETRARNLNKKILWLDTMKNGPALQFYLKNGFKIHGETKLPFPETIVSERPMYILTKNLR